jgi:hypothetical protein
MYNPNSVILYRGPSELDGAPIVVVVSGLTKTSTNGKTGDLLQTWILRDDINPIAAVETGADASVCGDCPHRGAACYVNLGQAPLNVWRTTHRGRYATAADLDAIRAIGAGRMVRLGAYGDPAAVPVAIWEALTERAAGWTGYTHQWRKAPQLKRFCMASADTPAEGFAARAQGWRTFRIRLADEPVAARLEFVCPASEEAGAKTDCASCKACMGSSAKAKASPVIAAHGAKKRRFALYRAGELLAA